MNEIEIVIFVVLMSLIGLVLSFFLMKSICGSLSILSCASFFMLNYVVRVFIGSAIINVVKLEAEISYGLYDRPDLVFWIWIYSLLGLVLIPIGMMLINIMTRYSPSISRRWMNCLSDEEPKDQVGNTTGLYWLFWLFFIIALGTLYLYLEKLDRVPILAVLFEDGLSLVDLAILRSDASNNFEGKIYRYWIFMKAIPTLIMIISLLLSKYQKKFLMLSFLFFVLNLFVAVLTLEKGPIVLLFVLLIITMLYRDRRLNVSYIMGSGIIAFGALSMMYTVYKGFENTDYLGILAAIFHRIFVGGITTAYWYQLFVEEQGFLLGASFANPGGLLPFEHRAITIEIMNTAFRMEGVVGSMPSVFFAEWYVNFGFGGVVISMVLFGMLIQGIDVYFITHLHAKRNLLKSALFIYLIIFVSKYTATGFMSFVLDAELFIPIIFTVIAQHFYHNAQK